MGQGILRKLELAKNGILEKSNLYLLEFTFTNACAVQSKHGTNKIGNKNSAKEYWQLAK